MTYQILAHLLFVLLEAAALSAALYFALGPRAVGRVERAVWAMSVLLWVYYLVGDLAVLVPLVQGGAP